MSLTKAEEKVMNHLWKLKNGSVKDLLQEFEEPKPATTTLLTLLKRLKEKEFVSYHNDNRYRTYFPVVSKENYFSKSLKDMVKEFFNNSPKQFASFYAEKTDLSKEDLESLKKIINSQIEKK
ncbi:MAG: BlaI/MecI/CopY family transcriptional regulator [Flavobacteriaceae bacterium]|nr:MAG: BlaI/MecI/CopY family transcriptional regulator [Flavobacteriaceae bacterium]